MEYIAIALNRNDVNDYISKLEDLATSKDILLQRSSDLFFDKEVEDGVYSFSKKFDIEPYQVIKRSAFKDNKSSSEISQELVDVFLKGTASNFINLLQDNKHVLPKSFFIIFAFDWPAGGKVRFESIDLNKLYDFFANNNGWYLWLYDYIKEFFVQDLDIPLVLKVVNRE